MNAYTSIYTVFLKKKLRKIVFVRTSTNFDNFWHQDGKEDKTM